MQAPAPALARTCARTCARAAALQEGLEGLMHAAEAGLAARDGALPGARRGGAAHAREGVKVADCIQSLRRAAEEGLSEHVY